VSDTTADGIGCSKMPKDTAFPRSLVQEYRDLIAVVTREACMRDKASGETAKGQQLLMEKMFHGSVGYASKVEDFLAGKGDAASMFNRIPIENNREGNSTRNSESHMLQLLDIFSCDQGNSFGD
jgi:hypothetical protein